MTKLCEMDNRRVEAVDRKLLGGKTYKTVRELATFGYTCRRCEDAPCIQVCPVEALKKNENGIIERALNLCIRCKSCVLACPFGTIMDDLFLPKTGGYHYFDLEEEEAMEQFASAFDNEAVTIVTSEANAEEHIFQLSDRVLVKEYKWVFDAD